ncbi:ribosome maturation factor RimM [Abyssisolibacter fermentans]|uniref:ribosome maturation factor RimM n=1 Tax=Abyssisolibacter fermentans TaxID=1766203 RepID=UPI00082F7DD8|nr:ribosome maturation factor RimM [Abyssisolibacter fermentans]
MDNKIQIGKIANTHGIRGYVKVIPLTTNMYRYDDLKEVFIDEAKFEIEDVWYKKDVVMVKFKGYDNINDVICYKNKFIQIDEKDLIGLDQDEYFIFDIVGLQVYLANGKYLGEIKEVLQPGANDVYVIKTKKSDVLIPAVKEIVKDINVKENKMIIDPIEGMIE